MDAMTTLRIDKWTEGFLWTAWSAHPKSHLAELLKSACPSLGQTERKRLAKSILQKQCNSIELEDSSNAHSLVSFLQGLGATIEVSGQPRLAKSSRNLRPR